MNDFSYCPFRTSTMAKKYRDAGDQKHSLRSAPHAPPAKGFVRGACPAMILNCGALRPTTPRAPPDLWPVAVIANIYLKHQSFPVRNTRLGADAAWSSVCRTASAIAITTQGPPRRARARGCYMHLSRAAPLPPEGGQLNMAIELSARVPTMSSCHHPLDTPLPRSLRCLHANRVRPTEHSHCKVSMCRRRLSVLNFYEH